MAQNQVNVLPRKTLIALALLSIICLLNLSLGSVSIPPKDILLTLLEGGHHKAAWEGIILKIRLPKLLTALLAGGALGIAGLQMQTLFRNPLAGPSVLGITAGASLGVALIVLSGLSGTAIFTLSKLGVGESWIMMIAATAGAAMVFGLILLISLRIKNNVGLLIIGLMVGNLTLALVSIWQYFSAPELIKDFLLWTFGNLSGVTNQQLLVLSLIVLLGSLGTFAISKPLDMLLLGDRYAKSMGLDIQKNRILIITITSLLAGTVTGFCGPIGFIGIAVPHITRQLFRSSRHYILIPNTFIIGALVLTCCDLIAQLPNSFHVLPINAVTALFGSPVVIWVMLRKQASQSEVLTEYKASNFLPPSHKHEEITATELAVGYGKKQLLQNMQLHLATGQLITLVGRNGAGKSTLLHTLAGLIPPLAGKMVHQTLDWRQIGSKEKARLMSLVLTEKDFFGNLRVSDLVAMGRYAHLNWWGKLNATDLRWIAWAMSVTQLSHLKHRTIASLSDGERQKALIARALAQNTPYLLLDEPTAHLDPANKLMIFELLQLLATDYHKAILISTHEIHLALNHAHQVWVVEPHKTLGQYTPHELLNSQILEKTFGKLPVFTR